MRCPSCDRKSPSDARFCMHCGSTLARSCAGCGGELPAEARFCPAAVRPLPPRVPQPQSRHASRPRAHRSTYAPRHLADEILRSKSALEGERKQVTVFFADVKGSLELVEQLDPEAWHRMLERFFEILTDGVHRFEGTVDQYTGDGIMALFGVPIAHEDHAQRACYAALRPREEIARYATEVKREYGVWLLDPHGHPRGRCRRRQVRRRPAHGLHRTGAHQSDWRRAWMRSPRRTRST